MMAHRGRMLLGAAALTLAASGLQADVSREALLPCEGRPVTAIVFVGHKVTKDYVIERELRTRQGQPFRVDTLLGDVVRLENLSIFADISVVPEVEGEGLRLTLQFKEMPSWVPLVGFSFTEEDGFSAGPKLSALNLKGRDIALSARAYFGGAQLYSANFSWPWISGNHRSFDFYGARLQRQDSLNDFKETSYEFAPEVGTYLGEHGRLKGKFYHACPLVSDRGGPPPRCGEVTPRIVS